MSFSRFRASGPRRPVGLEEQDDEEIPTTATMGRHSAHVAIKEDVPKEDTEVKRPMVNSSMESAQHHPSGKTTTLKSSLAKLSFADESSERERGLSTTGKEKFSKKIFAVPVALQEPLSASDAYLREESASSDWRSHYLDAQDAQSNEYKHDSSTEDDLVMQGDAYEEALLGQQIEENREPVEIPSSHVSHPKEKTYLAASNHIPLKRTTDKDALKERLEFAIRKQSELDHEQLHQGDEDDDDETERWELSTIRRGILRKTAVSERGADLAVDFDAWRHSRARRDFEKLSRLPDELREASPAVSVDMALKHLNNLLSALQDRVSNERTLLEGVRAEKQELSHSYNQLIVDSQMAAHEEAFFKQLVLWCDDYIATLRICVPQIEELEGRYHRFLVERALERRTRMRHHLQNVGDGEQRDLFRECIISDQSWPDSPLTASESDFRRDAAEKFLALLKALRPLSYDHLTNFFMQWREQYAAQYKDSFAMDAIPLAFEWRVRADLVTWEPFRRGDMHQEMATQEWVKVLKDVFSDEQPGNIGKPSALAVVTERVVLPKLLGMYQHVLDAFDSREVRHAVELVEIIRQLAPRAEGLKTLVHAMEDTLQSAMVELLLDFGEMNSKSAMEMSMASAHAFCYYSMQLIISWSNCQGLVRAELFFEAVTSIAKRMLLPLLDMLILLDIALALLILVKITRSVGSDRLKSEFLVIMKPTSISLVEALLTARLSGHDEVVRSFITDIIVPLEMYEDASRMAKMYQIR